VKIAAVETVRIGSFPNLLFVRVESADGIVGTGETYYGAGAVDAYIHQTAADRLLERPVASIDAVSVHLAGYVGRGGSGAETRGNSAIDIALWDLHAKACGRPLGDLVAHRVGTGVRCRDTVAERIPVYNTCAGPGYVRSLSYQEARNWGLEGVEHGRYEDLEAALSDAGALAQDLLAHGITAMKIWPFDRAAERSGGTTIDAEMLDEALVPLESIRSAVGDRMRVKVELHGLWSAPGIDDVLAALVPFEPAWVEDPVVSSDVWEGARVTAATSFPIAAGETLSGLHAFRHLCERRAADVVICDAGWCGGITTALQIAALAHEHGLAFALHDCTGPIGLAVATHLACALPNVAIQEFARAFYFGWYQWLVTGLPALDDGWLRPSDAAGHGIDLAPELLARSDVTVTRTTR
jgi:L-alanine-DL-glutamate epimerase-like enolase superfamily enzyme